MNKSMVFKVLMLVWVVCQANAVYGFDTLRFDFEPSGVTPEAGYIHVDENTAYSVGQGYGIFTDPGKDSENKWASDRGAVSPYGQYKDFVAMGKFRDFRIDVPNGDYFVTVVAGDPSFSNQERIFLEGQVYGAITNGSFVEVKPLGAPVYIRQHTGFTSDIEQIAIPSTSTWRTESASGLVRILGQGTGSFTDEDSKNIEYLTVDKVQITVTDGQITVENQWGPGNYLNFVEVTSATCDGILSLGYGVEGDINKDCKVNFEDFATLAEYWMVCNTPNNDLCTKTW